MSMLKYKGYTGVIDVDPEAGVIHGTVIGMRDTITFEADTPKKIARAFRDSVDDYLEFCQDKGKEPDKPYSGRLVLRMPAEIHRKLDEVSRAQHSSINRLAVSLIEKELAEI
jgi:predicted HicB family RNase H-like nuclease